MSPEDGFLQAISDAPDDDGPRLIYADWLEENGDAARAEFIRLQVALANLPSNDPRRTTMERRVLGLLEEHERAWAGPLWRLKWMRASSPWTFRRGLVEEIRLECQDVVDHLEDLVRRTVLRGLRLVRTTEGTTGTADLRAALSALARLPHLRALSLGDNSLNETDVSTLLASPLGRLTSLDLSDNVLGYGYRHEEAGPCAPLLAGSPRLAGLTTLRLSKAGLTDGDVAELAGSPHLARLTTLHLDHNYIRDQGVEALAASRHLGRLETLVLSYCHIGTDGALVLARSRRLEQLKQLDLDGNWNIRGEGQRRLQSKFGRRVHLGQWNWPE